MMNLSPDRSQPFSPLCSTNSRWLTGESCKSYVFVLARAFRDEYSHIKTHPWHASLLCYNRRDGSGPGSCWKTVASVCVIDGRVCECLMKQDPAEQSRDGEREMRFSQRAHAWHCCKHSHICSVSISALYLLPLDVFFLLTFSLVVVSYFSGWLILVGNLDYIRFSFIVLLRRTHHPFILWNEEIAQK